MKALQPKKQPAITKTLPNRGFTPSQGEWLEKNKTQATQLLLKRGFKRDDVDDIYQNQMEYIGAKGFPILFDKKLGEATPEAALKAHLNRQLYRKGIDFSRSRKCRPATTLSDKKLRIIADNKVTPPETTCSSKDFIAKLRERLLRSLSAQGLVIFDSFCKAGTFHSDDLFQVMSEKDRQLFQPKIVAAGKTKAGEIKRSIGRRSGETHLSILQVLITSEILMHLRVRIIKNLNWYESIIYNALITSKGSLNEKELLKVMPPQEALRLESMMTGLSPSNSKPVLRMIRKVSLRLVKHAGSLVIAEII